MSSQPSPDTLPVIRLATPDDLAAITEIYGASVLEETASFELRPPDLDTMTERYDTLISGGYPYLVADLDGVVAGYAYAGPYRPRPAYQWTVENSIYFAQDHRGKGIGAALLQALITASEARGYRQMIAVLGGADFEASHRLHLAHGFVDIGQLPAVGRKHRTWHDILIMQRALGDGSRTPPNGQDL